MTDANPAPAQQQPLSIERKIQIGLDAKAKGNDAFTGGDPKAALRHYHTSVLYLSGLDQMGLDAMMGRVSSSDGRDVSPIDESDQPAVPAHKKHLSQSYSNMAACHLKLQNFPRAIDAADKAAKADPTNIKATFRKAQALRQGGSLHQAITLLKQTIEKSPKDKDSLAGELALCEKSLKAKEAQSRNKFKGFLSKNPNVFSSTTGEGEAESGQKVVSGAEQGTLGKSKAETAA